MAFGLGKKKREAIAQPPQEPLSNPVDQVLSMRQQGYSNNQIIQTLQRQNYSSSQIFDAMNQADVSGKEIPPSYFQEGTEQPGFPQPPAQEQPQQQMEEQYPQQQAEDYSEKIEEIAESIIEEKWGDLVKDIGKIVEWKNKVESRITSMEQEFKDLKGDFESLHKAIIGKVGDYDKNILNVGTEIKAMERVFQKILPKMTENVNELSRITKDIKVKKK